MSSSSAVMPKSVSPSSPGLHVTLNESDVCGVVMKFLEERGYAETMRCFERESGIVAESEMDEVRSSQR